MHCITTTHSPEERIQLNFLLQANRADSLYGYLLPCGRNDMLFDGDVHTHPRTDFTFPRVLLRSARLEEPREIQSDLIEGHEMTETNWMVAPEEAKNGVKMLEAFEAAVPNPLCELCHLRASHTCGHCFAAWYCGRQHQKKDWKDHKYLCQMIKKGDPEFFK